MQIIVEPLVQQKLSDLLQALLDKGYFATEDSATAYVRDIRSFIGSIPKRTFRKTKNNRYGEYYVIYKANCRATWYNIFNRTMTGML